MTYIAVLRAVNVTGHNRLTMADLRKVAIDLDLGEVRTLLQSGNLVFSARKTSSIALERRLEAETSTRLGVTTDFFVRTADEWRAAVDANPFRAEAVRDPGHLVLMVLKTAPR